MTESINWLNTGQQFPPVNERERLARYNYNKQIFDNRHTEVYARQFERIEKVIGHYQDWVSYPIVLNYQKKISLKTADFLFVEPPVFTVGSGNGKMDTIREIVTCSDLVNIGYQGVIDCSRYGTCVYKIDVVDGKGIINISSPEYLFACVEENDRKKVSAYVLAWKVAVNNQWGQDKEHLVAFVHERGKYTKVVYEIDGEIIGNLVEEDDTVTTGLDSFAIVPIHNVVTSDSIYGIDDYDDVDSIVSELEIRTAQISKILDVHANPTVSGSQNALTYDKATGEYYFDAGNYYARTSNEEPSLEYITWEASLDANFKQIERLLNHLSVISEMGAAIFDGELKTGNLPSGSALKRLYINALAKVARVRNAFDMGLKKAIAIASQIGYDEVLSVEDISIMWQDGLPNDPKEMAEIISIRTAGTQTMSAKRAMVEYDGMSEEQASEEIKTLF